MFSTVVFTSAETAAAVTPPEGVLISSWCTAQCLARMWACVVLRADNVRAHTDLVESLLLERKLHAFCRHELSVPARTEPKHSSERSAAEKSIWR